MAAAMPVVDTFFIGEFGHPVSIKTVLRIKLRQSAIFQSGVSSSLLHSNYEMHAAIISIWFSESRNMNWNDIRYFLAVARHSGLTGAAKQLGVSQSTVARRVETLEAALRTRFFERYTDGYQLTEEGREMMEKAIAIEESMVEIENDLGGRDIRGCHIN
jgi:DNA-binding MarR family transcriptional regulator